jgi:6-phosphogluconolactonase/glucosamine-6-phosphate isomerase/deaminase
MGFSIVTTSKTDPVANFLASSILNQLKLGKKVLFFVTGGSSILIGVKVSEILKKDPNQNLIKNLSIALTDERYGPIGHPDSNFFKLMENGFELPSAKIIPTLTGDDPVITAEKFNQTIKEELKSANYKIALFGVGKDGHVAGILPGSTAVHSEDFVCGYTTPVFYRVTITEKTIEKLDEAVVFMQGEEKWAVVDDLYKDVDIIKQPAQILKKVPLLTIFSDYVKKNE